MSTINEPAAFIVKQEDTAMLLSEMGLKCNEGSGFYKATVGRIPGSVIGSKYIEFKSNEDFLLAMRIASQPDLYVTTRSAGIKGMSESRLHRKNTEGSFVVLTEQGEGDDVVITIFNDYKGYLDILTQEVVGLVEAPVANYIPPEVGLEEFMLILHTIDSFRRVSYQNLLDHIYIDRAYIKTAEFTQGMAGSLGSLDIRWLLPAFMAVTPGIELYQTKLNAKSLEILMAHDFLTEGRLGSGEEVLVFGEAGQVMGVEFLYSWLLSCGCEINIAGENGFKAIERFFIAPTMLTNHFVRLRDVQDGKAMVNHQTYITEQLVAKLNEIFDKAFSLKVSPIPTVPESTTHQTTSTSTVPHTAQTTPTLSTPKFCRNCGAKLASDARFCVSCGMKIE